MLKTLEVPIKGLIEIFNKVS